MKERTIKVLQDLISKVEAGEVESIAIVCLSDTGCERHILAGRTEDVDALQVLGAITMLHSHLLQRVEVQR